MRKISTTSKGTFAWMLVVACTGRHAASTASVPSPDRDSVLVAPTATSVDSAIPAGSVVGIVVAAYTGTPLANVAISARAADSSKPEGMVTGDDGRFRLSGLAPRPIALSATLIGYMNANVVIDGKSGTVVRFGMPAEKLIVCGLVIPPTYAIGVGVRDVRTGFAPTDSVTLRIQDGAYVDVVRSPGAEREYSAAPLVLQAGPDRTGTFDVQVAASGYESWRANRVKTKYDGACQRNEGRGFMVWLLPSPASSRD